MLHLQRVAASPHCKMGIDSLAKVLAPTVVGYSAGSASDPASMAGELGVIKMVLESLLLISCDYWDNFLGSGGGSGSGEENFPPLNTPEMNEQRKALPSALKTQGAVARRTRSKYLARQQYFESPMLF